MSNIERTRNTGVPSGRARRRAFIDQSARWVITAGGFAVVGGIVAILLFIGVEVVPLWGSSSVSLSSQAELGENVIAVRTDEQREILEVVAARGSTFQRLADGQPFPLITESDDDAAAVLAAAPGVTDEFTVDRSGTLRQARTNFHVRFVDGVRTIEPVREPVGTWALASGEITSISASRVTDDAFTLVYFDDRGSAKLFAVSVAKSLFGKAKSKELRADLPFPDGARALAAVVTSDGDYAYIAGDTGHLAWWDLRDAAEPKLLQYELVGAPADGLISQLHMLIGDRSLVVGDDRGRVSLWFAVRRGAEGRRVLVRVRDFEAHRAAVTAIAASPRGRTFATADEIGQVILRHATSGEVLARQHASDGPVRILNFSPKADGLLTVDDSGVMKDWAVHNPHPGVTLQTLFGKVWYEGYDEPAYVWQSTGGTDAFESKFSLVPLIFGTVKGTLYALLFAIPLAVFGAIYTSQFCHPQVRDVVKPTIEIMAALPSVVLGMIAGLWLAPVLEDTMPALLAMSLLIPGALLMAGSTATRLRGPGHQRRVGADLLVMAIVVGVSAGVCLAANDLIEAAVFRGDFVDWLRGTGMRFDQRNCVVVGFAMGFAVIPIIFTISEDALSNVPKRLVSASLALGATPWQTAVRVVLPTASPGIFSAVMIGLGRAIGETMIVLMATGNTPILDWDIFTGMRTLSANIAVEIPEAPHGGTLYRILFLTAFLLFLATFFVNTAAEMVRMRLRRRYQEG